MSWCSTLELGIGERREELCLHIGGDNASHWPDALTQPGGDRAAPSADLQAVGPWLQAQCAEVLNSLGV